MVITQFFLHSFIFIIRIVRGHKVGEQCWTAHFTNSSPSPDHHQHHNGQRLPATHKHPRSYQAILHRSNGKDSS